MIIDIKEIKRIKSIFSAKDVQEVFKLSARQAYYVIRILLKDGSIVPAKIELQTLFTRDMRVKYYQIRKQ